MYQSLVVVLPRLCISNIPRQKITNHTDNHVCDRYDKSGQRKHECNDWNEHYLKGRGCFQLLILKTMNTPYSWFLLKSTMIVWKWKIDASSLCISECQIEIKIINFLNYSWRLLGSAKSEYQCGNYYLCIVKWKWFASHIFWPAGYRLRESCSASL